MTRFGGETYDSDRDGERLAKQLERVKSIVLIEHPGRWFTLDELSRRVGAPEASVSARLRDHRKPKFGGINVERRYVSNGLWEYRANGQRECRTPAMLFQDGEGGAK